MFEQARLRVDENQDSGHVQRVVAQELTARHQADPVRQSLGKASGIRLAVGGDTVECPASRNPGGVYTDMGGGAKTGAYTISLRK